MTMKKPIETATASELARFANIHYGIEVAHQKGKEHILTLLHNVGFEGAEIDVEGPSEQPSAAVQRPVIGAEIAPARGGKALRMVNLTLHETETPGSTEGTDPVWVAVNGSGMWVPRGRPVNIPFEYFAVLQNAKIRQYAPPPDEFTPLGEYRDVPRHAMSVHSIDADPREKVVA